MIDFFVAELRNKEIDVTREQVRYIIDSIILEATGGSGAVSPESCEEDECEEEIEDECEEDQCNN